MLLDSIGRTLEHIRWRAIRFDSNVNAIYSPFTSYNQVTPSRANYTYVVRPMPRSSFKENFAVSFRIRVEYRAHDSLFDLVKENARIIYSDLFGLTNVFIHLTFIRMTSTAAAGHTAKVEHKKNGMFRNELCCFDGCSFNSALFSAAATTGSIHFIDWRVHIITRSHNVYEFRTA